MKRKEQKRKIGTEIKQKHIHKREERKKTKENRFKNEIICLNQKRTLDIKERKERRQKKTDLKRK